MNYAIAAQNRRSPRQLPRGWVILGGAILAWIIVGATLVAGFWLVKFILSSM